MTDQPSSSAAIPEPPDSTTAARRLTYLYVAALSTVALLTIVAQVLVQRQLESNQNDSHVVNIAGRQRMLSQRLAKSSLQLAMSPPTNFQSIQAEIAIALKEWDANHNGLQHRDKAIGLQSEPSQRLTELYATVRPHYDSIRLAAQTLVVAKPGDDLSEPIRVIGEHESAFLKGMDDIVSQCVLEAENRIARLRQSEAALLTLTLFVLAAEGLLIFRPAVRQIKQVVARLEQTGANLAVAKKQAEAASEAKTRFLANVSHELRTPMTAVLGMTELAKETSDPGIRTQYLSIVEQSGQSLLRLLNDLIDTAKIEVSEPEITDSVFSPLAVSHQVVELLRPSAVSKGLDFEFSHNEVADCFAHGDSLRLTQVLTNLVGNAIKYTDAGFVHVALDVHSDDDRCRLHWTISDSGIGVSKEDQSKLFEPFFQAYSAAETTRGGAGLGLSICQQIIKAMGGSITFTSALDQGTTVSVELNLLIASADVSSPTEGPSIPSRASACLNVLVVEDSPVLQWMLKEWLQSAGHRVSVASDGDEAIECYRTCGADLVVTDYRLGAINGAETARRIRAIAKTNLRPALSILCLTGDAGVTPSLPRDEVFDAVAMKPIRRNAFYQLIENVIGAKSPMPASKADDDASDFRQELGVELARILPTQLTDLHHALKTEDFQTAKLLAHRLRGQVAYFDQPDTERLLLHLERASESKDESAAIEGYQEVERRLNTLVQAFSLHDAAPSIAYN